MIFYKSKLETLPKTFLKNAELKTFSMKGRLL